MTSFLITTDASDVFDDISSEEDIDVSNSDVASEENMQGQPWIVILIFFFMNINSAISYE